MRDLEYENVKSDKIARILGIYTKLMNGGIVNKAEEARQYGVNERSIQRDIDDIREYFENETADIGFINSVTYDRSAKGYRLEQLYKTRLSNSEILAVCMRTKDKKIVRRKLKPVAILFTEYYFYLTAFIDDKEVQENFDVLNDAFPTIYRLDRIKKLKLLDEKFHIPYSSRFEEGEFRKRIQFMYGGKLQKVKFEYSGTDVDAVLDRLPTARIVKEEDGRYVIEAEVFGKGIEMWLRSQGDTVTLMEGE